jgi:hypothetical protein
MKIIISLDSTEYCDHYRAFLETNPDDYSGGDSISSALGNFLLSHRDMFGVVIEMGTNPNIQ